MPSLGEVVRSHGFASTDEAKERGRLAAQERSDRDRARALGHPLDAAAVARESRAARSAHARQRSTSRP